MGIDKLNEMKEKIEKAKTEKSRLEGKMDELKDQLKKAGYDSVKEAEEALVKMEETLDKLDAEFESGITELEEKYNWE